MTRRLWNKDFILLLQGSAVSTIGDLMYSVAIGFWVYQETGSTTLMGIMAAISLFISMFLSPFTGSIIDKCNRKWMLVCMDLLQAAVMLTVGIVAFTGNLNVPLVLVAAVIAAFGSVFYSPAASTVMLDIIPRDDMVRGQSLFSGTNSLINLISNALSGVMVAFLGVPLIVTLNGISNLYSAISEMFITVPKTVGEGKPVTVKTVAHDTADAVKTIFRDPCIRVFVPLMLILNFLGAGASTLMLPFCDEKGFSVDMYGYLMAVWTAASLVSVMILGIIKFGQRARFYIMAVSFTLSCVMFVIGYLCTDFILMCVFMFLGAFMNAAGNTIFSASMMLALPEENRGAILGFVQSACVGGVALSSVVYGLFCDVFPIYIVFIVGSALSLIPMLYLCIHPRTREFILTH